MKQQMMYKTDMERIYPAPLLLFAAHKPRRFTKGCVSHNTANPLFVDNHAALSETSKAIIFFWSECFSSS